MAEEVMDTVLFHQPVDEIEIRFLILYAVVALAIGRGQVVGDVESRQNMAQYLGGRQVLENPAPARSCQQPDLRYHARPIIREPRIAAALTEAVHNAIEMPDGDPVRLERQRDRATQDLVERHRPLDR